MCFQIPTPCNALKCLTAWLNSFWHWINLKSNPFHKHLKCYTWQVRWHYRKKRFYQFNEKFIKISRYILITVLIYIPSRRVHVKTFLQIFLFQGSSKGFNLRKLNLNYLLDNRVEFSLPTEYSLCLCISTFP